MNSNALFNYYTTIKLPKALKIDSAERQKVKNDDILRFTDLDGRCIPIMPMALWSVIKDTPGVCRFQAIQTAPPGLKVRLQTKIAGEEAQVWEMVKQHVQDYFDHLGLGIVQIVHATITRSICFFFDDQCPQVQWDSDLLARQTPIGFQS